MKNGELFACLYPYWKRNFPMKPLGWLVGWSVGWLVDQMVCHNFLIWREVTLPCFYWSHCSFMFPFQDFTIGLSLSRYFNSLWRSVGFSSALSLPLKGTEYSIFSAGLFSHNSWSDMDHAKPCIRRIWRGLLQISSGYFKEIIYQNSSDLMGEFTNIWLVRRGCHAYRGVQSYKS